MAEFAEVLSKVGLDNEIKGTNEDNEVLINVFFKPSQRESILDLIEWVDEHVSYEDEEDDDEYDDDDEEYDDDDN
ncbi:MAG: hypothetical protein WCK02_17855 [Bacteroidota bacterium]